MGDCKGVVGWLVQRYYAVRFNRIHQAEGSRPSMRCGSSTRRSYAKVHVFLNEVIMNKRKAAAIAILLWGILCGVLHTLAPGLAVCMYKSSSPLLVPLGVLLLASIIIAAYVAGGSSGEVLSLLVFWVVQVAVYGVLFVGFWRLRLRKDGEMGFQGRARMALT